MDQPAHDLDSMATGVPAVTRWSPGDRPALGASSVRLTALHARQRYGYRALLLAKNAPRGGEDWARAPQPLPLCVGIRHNPTQALIRLRRATRAKSGLGPGALAFVAVFGLLEPS